MTDLGMVIVGAGEAARGRPPSCARKDGPGPLR